jgi:hypothetical protein
MNAITPQDCVKNAGLKGFCFIDSAISLPLLAAA